MLRLEVSEQKVPLTLSIYYSLYTVETNSLPLIILINRYSVVASLSRGPAGVSVVISTLLLQRIMVTCYCNMLSL